jgi:hypothetical protein
MITATEKYANEHDIGFIDTLGGVGVGVYLSPTHTICSYK